MAMKARAVLLAAGKGTRMRSRLPKLLHPLGGRPMILHCLDAAKEAGDGLPILVVGYGAEALRAAVGDQAEFVEQAEQLGTGHALQQTQAALQGKADLILVSNADLPLLKTETLQSLLETQKMNKGPFTMLTLNLPEARGFGRIKRSEAGEVMAIVEEVEASPQELVIEELNVGAYCFRADWLWPALDELKPSPKKKEYYLTDLVEIASKRGLHIEVVVLQDPEEAIGINTREHLAEAEAALRRRVNRHWMLEGVTLVDPQSTYIEAGVLHRAGYRHLAKQHAAGRNAGWRRLRHWPQYSGAWQPHRQCVQS